MSRISHTGRAILELLLTITIGLVPIACGLLVTVVQMQRQLDKTAQLSLHEAVYVIDRVIDSLHESAIKALPLATRPCSEVMEALRIMSIHHPNVRSLVLTRNKTGVCSTILGEIEHKVLKEPSVNQRLGLIYDAPSSPDLPVLVYRLLDDDPGVIATAMGRVLQSELLGFQGEPKLLVEFGGDAIWVDGDSRTGVRPDFSEHTDSLQSVKYGYVVRVGYPAGHIGREVRLTLPLILPSLVLVGLLTAAFAYWGMTRNRPRQAHAAR
ncbi:hypothetical protein G7009_13380 [Pseudomonas capeferrum]|uniref:CSS-motif domain-containing protein n=1 Tax=Pseudomonas capeferrum TaxID=1495066 RepID=UPI0015E2E804|nr:CSS-motif domain-containing protein [Pseudomonas capeferrum]MBA1202733.1 hypothetical protein [Pseudomonas capeferrum]